MNFIQSLKESIGTFYYGLVSSYVRRLHSHLEVLEGRVSALYAHLESRGVPMPTDEEGNPLPKDTLHLLPTLRHLDTRRIESCTNEIADGTSAAVLLFGNIRSSITNFVDTARGWTLTNMPNLSQCTSLTLGCRDSSSDVQFASNNSTLAELHLIGLEDVTIYGNKGSSGWGKIQTCPNITSLYFPELKTYNANTNHSSSYEGFIWNMPNLKEFIAPKLEYIHSLSGWTGNAMLSNISSLEKVVVGKLTHHGYGGSTTDGFFNTNNPNLLHFEVGEGTEVSFRLTMWSPTLDSSNLIEFQSNFHEYIAKRLATFPKSGSHPTLTLSQTVRDAITMDSENLIVQTKHWSLAPARTV